MYYREILGSGRNSRKETEAKVRTKFPQSTACDRSRTEEPPL